MTTKDYCGSGRRTS